MLSPLCNHRTSHCKSVCKLGRSKLQKGNWGFSIFPAKRVLRVAVETLDVDREVLTLTAEAQTSGKVSEFSDRLTGKPVFGEITRASQVFFIGMASVQSEV